MIRRVAAKWEDVATSLYFEGYEIQSIQRDQHYQTRNACRAMFIEWLRGEGRKPTTWNTLIKALEEAELSEVANDLRDELSV